MSGLFYQAFYILFLNADKLSVPLDTTSVSYKVGVYIGSFLPFIALIVIFLLIIRSRYRFKK